MRRLVTERVVLVPGRKDADLSSSPNGRCCCCCCDKVRITLSIDDTRHVQYRHISQLNDHSVAPTLRFDCFIY